MSTNFPQAVSRLRTWPLASFAQSLFIQAIRTEGLRVSNPSDVERIAKFSVEAARALDAELKRLASEGDQGTVVAVAAPPASPDPASTGPLGPEGEADKASQKDPKESDSTELGSIEEDDSGLEIHESVSPDGLSWYRTVRQRGQTEEGLGGHASYIVHRKPTETGSIENQELEAQLAEVAAERVVAVLRADELAGQVTVLKLEVQDLKEDRDGHLNQIGLLKGELDEAKSHATRIDGKRVRLLARHQELLQRVEGEATEVESIGTATRRRLTKDAELGDRVRGISTRRLGQILALGDEFAIVEFDEDGCRESVKLANLEFIGGPESTDVESIDAKPERYVLRDGDLVRVPELGTEGTLEILRDGRCRVTASSGSSVRTWLNLVIPMDAGSIASEGGA